MSGESSPRARPSTEWLVEQEAKQAAYAARRRAWTEMLQRAAEGPGEEETAPATEGPAASPTSAPSQARRRPRGPVHDTRQGRFEF